MVDLINLQDGVDEDGQVGHAEADDLNGVLEAERVPCQQQDVEKAEDEEGQECGYRAVLRLEAVAEVLVTLVHETKLEPPKHVSAATCQHRDGCLVNETAVTYDSKATQIKACRPTTRKKSFAHFEARKSVEKSFCLGPPDGAGTLEAIMGPSSR